MGRGWRGIAGTRRRGLGSVLAAPQRRGQSATQRIGFGHAGVGRTGGQRGAKATQIDGEVLAGGGWHDSGVRLQGDTTKRGGQPTLQSTMHSYSSRFEAFRPMDSGEDSAPTALQCKPCLSSGLTPATSPASLRASDQAGARDARTLDHRRSRSARRPRCWPSAAHRQSRVHGGAGRARP